MNEIFNNPIFLVLVGFAAAFLFFKFKATDNNNNTSDTKEIKDQISQINNFITNKEERLKEILEKIEKEGNESQEEFAKKLREFQQIMIGNIQAQGDAGEDMLEKILEITATKFRKEKIIKDNNNKSFKPDFIVTLPHDREIVIDCKTSLDHWNQYVNATDKNTKNLALTKHVDAMISHIDGLAKKNYQDKIDDTINTVVMFSTNELSIHAIGSKYTAKILEHAFKKNITICGPSQLFFLLKVVEKQWAHQKQSQNIREVAKIGSDIFDKISDVYKLFDLVISSFNSIVGNLISIKNKLQGNRSLKQDAIKMKSLGNLLTKNSDIKAIRTIKGEEVEEPEDNPDATHPGLPDKES